jgi:hypothetical protein
MSASVWVCYITGGVLLVWSAVDWWRCRRYRRHYRPRGRRSDWLRWEHEMAAHWPTIRRHRRPHRIVEMTRRIDPGNARWLKR